MAKSKQTSKQFYGISLQMCGKCASYVLVAVPKPQYVGAVDLASCLAVDCNYYNCGSKMAPITSTTAISTLLDELRANLERI